jgi:DNA-binding transcriptional regulator LsrR (DeoR family)
VPRDPTIPDAVRRFVLTSVPSVPFLEAAGVFHSNAGVTFTVEAIASALYVARETAEKLLAQLLEAGIVVPASEGYRYEPRDAELASALEALFACYQANLVGITNLVHDATQRSAERFANAFKLRKDP